MRRIRFQPWDTAEPFVIDEVPVPVPGPGQLLVHTEVVGVGIGLVRMLRGRTAPEAGPGGEMVGRVAALGVGVAGFEVGDRVGGVVFEDVYARSVLAAPALVTRVPPEVTAPDALALVRGGLVALGALRAGRFERGESVLVTAAASGSGHLAVQLARALGAGRVVAAVGSPEKAGFVRGCGADEVVTYGQESWGDPVDVVLDGVGGALVQRGVDALAPHGRLVAFSAGGGAVDAGSLLGDLKSVTGFSVGRISRDRPERIARLRAELWDLHAAGRLHPAHTALPLDRIAEAVELVEARGNLGRVLLRTG
ncbi:zinc-binding dehydrogenase [Streptomyces sp. NBC_01387]|uniref:quinone oxidoreductase family protein n=1 Tax=unclassified Streptomyces TaxID=2593676 RepID=UPI002DDA6474|nr:MULTISPECIES: zinc-binding dehydrogenase [unclassified Streptomyces]WSC20550.1 zinc-binding dehydrogenase [Streptomyces sp. NBC_01766]WSV54582.1 zinc-binding dehydrogenase [Streptomyces sp. NBC_01014]